MVCGKVADSLVTYVIYFSNIAKTYFIAKYLPYLN
jgi:hypothetical protein